MHAVVELAAETRRPREDAQSLELVLVDRRGSVGRLGVDELHGRDPVVVVRDGVVTTGQVARAEHEDRAVLLERDLALRREPGAQQLAREPFARLGLGRRRKSSSARRHTRIGATIRAFGVSSSASQDSPTAIASTSLETIRFR